MRRVRRWRKLREDARIEPRKPPVAARMIDLEALQLKAALCGTVCVLPARAAEPR